MRSAIEMILDENCNDNVTLFGADGQAIEFRQIALIPLDEQAYVILQPINVDFIQEDEALVFEVEQKEQDFFLNICEEDALVDRVFAKYYEMLAQLSPDGGAK